MKYVAVLVSKDYKSGDKFTVTPKMMENAPHFETEQEANDYCDLISTDYLWVIAPKE